MEAYDKDVQAELEKARKELGTDEYRKLLTSIQLNSIDLTGLKLQKVRPLVDSEHLLLISRLPHSEENRQIEDLSLNIYIRYRVAVARRDDENDVLFEIQADYRMRLTSEVNLPNAFLTIYSAVNAEYLVWPYMRELTASLTARMGYPQLTLPLQKPADNSEA